MVLNRDINKPVTSLSSGEIVTEKYNGSNAKFAIISITTTATSQSVTFSNPFKFNWISWGDNSSPVLGPLTNAQTHQYTNAGTYSIVIHGLDNFGDGDSTGQNLFTTAITINKVYFGEGVKIWGKDDSKQGFLNITSLTEVLNLSQVPDNFCNGCTQLSKITFNSDCAAIGTGAFSDIYTHTNLIDEEANIIPKKCLVIPKTVQTIGDNAFSGASNLYICIEYASDSEKPDAYSTTGNTYTYYSAECPTTNHDNYWGYFNGEPLLWSTVLPATLPTVVSEEIEE